MARTVPSSAPPAAVLDHIGDGAPLIVPLANGEPIRLLDAVEAHADDLGDVRSTRCTPSTSGATWISGTTGSGECHDSCRALPPHDRCR